MLNRPASPAPSSPLIMFSMLRSSLFTLAMTGLVVGLGGTRGGVALCGGETGGLRCPAVVARLTKAEAAVLEPGELSEEVAALSHELARTMEELEAHLPTTAPSAQGQPGSWRPRKRAFPGTP